jgi:hypothetical protein
MSILTLSVKHVRDNIDFMKFFIVFFNSKVNKTLRSILVDTPLVKNLHIEEYFKIILD